MRPGHGTGWRGSGGGACPTPRTPACAKAISFAGGRRRREEARALRDAFDALAGPERDRIRVELPKAERKLAEIEGQRDAAATFHRDHPEAVRRLIGLDREIDAAAYEMDLERQPLDGVAPAVLSHPKSTTGSSGTTGSWSGRSSSIVDSGWSCRAGRAQRPRRWAITMVIRAPRRPQGQGPTGAGFADGLDPA